MKLSLSQFQTVKFSIFASSNRIVTISFVFKIMQVTIIKSG